MPKKILAKKAASKPATSPASPAAPAKTVAQLKITLCYLEPDIWRRVLVPHDITLPKLHLVIQGAMGWTNSHMHAFQTKTAIYDSFPGDSGDFPPHPGAPKKFAESKHRLNDLLAEAGAECTYVYDFGDDWTHDIVLEKLTPADKRPARAVVPAGENACPPDDCGGVPGYCNLIEILFNPKHPEHEEMREWMGLDEDDTYDPTAFDLAAANNKLSRLKI